jgi:hypothetical protein
MSEMKAAEKVVVPPVARCERTAKDMISVLRLAAVETVFGCKRVIGIGPTCRGKKIIAQLHN